MVSQTYTLYCMLSIIMLCYIKILLINFIKYHSSCINPSHLSLVMMIKSWLLSRKRKRCGLTSWPTWPDLPLRSGRSGQERGQDVLLPASLYTITLYLVCWFSSLEHLLHHIQSEISFYCWPCSEICNFLYQHYKI